MSSPITIIETTISCYPIHDAEWPRLAICGEFENKSELQVQHVTVEIVLRGKLGQVLQVAEGFVDTAFHDGRCAFKVDCDYNPDYLGEIELVELRVVRCDIELRLSPTRKPVSFLPLTNLVDDDPFDPDLDDSGFNEDDLH